MHVALILDGNRRWAKKRGLSPWLGHNVGAKTLEKILILTSHTENALIKENTEKGMEYFIAAGYEKPKKLEMIEKISNVAANY